MLRALLVDDQPRATARLTSLLAEIGGIEVIGTARTLAEAREFLSGREPDVVFLEVSLPGRHGLELLADVGLQAHVIVVTASEVAAVAAFEYGALDYILKPVALPRLQLAVERLRRACGESKDGSRRGLSAARPLAPARLATDRVTADAKLPLVHAATQSMELVALEDINWISAVKRDSLVHTTAGEVPVRRRISEWESMLPEAVFQRLDRSLIVNLRRLVGTQSRSREQTLLTFNGIEQPLPIGRTAASRLREALGL